MHSLPPTLLQTELLAGMQGPDKSPLKDKRVLTLSPLEPPCLQGPRCPSMLDSGRTLPGSCHGPFPTPTPTPTRSFGIAFLAHCHKPFGQGVWGSLVLASFSVGP